MTLDVPAESSLSTESSPRSPWTSWRPYLRLLPAVLLIAVIVREKPWAKEWPPISLVGLAVMLAINFAVYLPTRVWRWRVALASPPSFWAIYASLLEGLLANAAIGFGSGDVVRAARLRGTATFTTDYGATIAERGAELVAIAGLMLLGVGIAGLGWAGVAGAVACLAVFGVAVGFGRRLLPRLRRWPRLATGLEAGLDASTFGRVAAMTVLSLAGWLSEVGIVYIGLWAFGMPPTFGASLLVVLGINVAIVLPGPPANFGTFEAGVVMGLRVAGISVERALLFGVGYHLILTIPVALAGAVVFLVRGRRV